MGRCRLRIHAGGAVMQMRLGLAIAGVLLVGAGAGRADEAIRADYLCKGRFDATPVTAFFFNQTPREVVLVVGESARRLPQAMSASGARYASGTENFWLKGDSATWQLGKAPAYQCNVKTPAR